MKINSVFLITIVSLVLAFSTGAQTLSAATQKTVSSTSKSSSQKRIEQSKTASKSSSSSSAFSVRSSSSSSVLSTAQQRLLLRKQKDVSASSAQSVSRSSSTSSAANTGLDMGIVIHNIDNRFFVYSIQNDSAALQSELQLGDEIMAIDGKELTRKMGEADVSKMLNGAEGSQSIIKIGRLNKGYMTITFTRKRKTELPVAQASTMSGMGILTINSLNAQSIPVIRKVCQELFDKGNLKGVVIDLHTNPNGVLEGVGQLASCFIPQNTTYITWINHARMASGRQEIPYVTKEKPIFPVGTKIAFLMRYRLSPATIVAGMAFKKKANAKLLYINALNTRSVSTPIMMLGPNGKEQEMPNDSALIIDDVEGIEQKDKILLDGSLTDQQGLQAAVDYLLYN